jgi:hypothetical protein
MQNKIFSFDSAKAIKAIEFGYYNAIHYLAPHSLSAKIYARMLRRNASSIALAGIAAKRQW